MAATATTPTLGRFIERDPIGFEAGDNNWYRFVANGPTRLIDPTGLQKPNIGSGRGPYHYTFHTVEFAASSSGKGCEQLRTNIYNALQSFKYFKSRHNWDATVRRDGAKAYFNAKGLFNALSDYVAWNAYEAPVSLEFFDDRFLVVATTLEGHMLDGKRYWTVDVTKGPFCQCNVKVTTWAYERKVGLRNDYGEWAGSKLWDSQMEVWDGCLMNVAEKFSTPGGCLTTFPFNRPYVRSEERQTNLFTIPEYP